MPVILQTTAYALNELPKDVQTRVLDRYRSFQVHDEWYCSVYEWADQAALLLGITINRKRINRFRLDTLPAIHFSGFSNQGDGACFEGHFTSPGDSTQIASRIAEFSPTDVDLLNIAKRIQHLLIHSDDRLTATLTHNGSRYQYPGTVNVNAELVDENGDTVEAACAPIGVENELTSVLHHFMDWIYRQLQDEYEHITSDTQVTDALTSNGFLFSEFGEPAA